MLEVKNIFFSYKKNAPLVLNNLSVLFPPKGLVSILGPNGCGKSTFLKCLSGVLNFTKGNILIKGHDIETMARRSIARKLSYVPQEYAPAFNANVFDYVMLGRIPYIDWAVNERDQEQVLETLQFMGIKKLAHRNILELSGGQRQLVSIARALAQDTDIILMDEPLSALDLKHSLEVMAKIIEIVNCKQALVVLIMHDIELAAIYSDEIVILKNGCFYDGGPPNQVITKHMLKEVYDVDADVTFDELGCRLSWPHNMNHKST